MGDSKNIAIPALARSFAIKPSSMNEEARTVEMIWTTGEQVKRADWDGVFLEELSLDPKHVRMTRLQSGTAPFLANHDSRGLDSVIGVVETANIGSARVRFAQGDPAADAAWNKVRQGILTNVSVGYRVHKFEKTEGGDEKTPVYRATDWEPFEISLVPMGADSAAQIRSAPLEKNDCEFVNRGTPQTEKTQMADEKKPAAVETQPAKNDVDLDAVRAESVKTERARTSGIQALVRKLNLGDEFGEKLVTDGVTLEAARAAILDEVASRSEKGAPSGAGRSHDISVGTEATEKFGQKIVAAMLARSGPEFRSNAKIAAEKKIPGFQNLDTDGAEFRSYSVSELARECLEAKGVKTRGMSKDRVAQLAMSQRSGGMAGTTDFPVLLENAMYKQLMASYATVQDTWKSFCGTMTVPDFRTSPRYRTGSFNKLDPKAENGEFLQKSIPDGLKYNISTKTYGNLMRVTRELLVNDDMGAIADTLGKFGRAAGLSIEVDAYAALALNGGLGPNLNDVLGTPLFDAGRGNIGTGAALSVAALDADRVLLAQQKDISNNEFLGLKPRTLLIAIGLGGQARVINASQYDVDAVTTGATNKFQVPNKVVGLFGEIVDTPRLSGTRRYLFVEGSQALVVVFLEGQEAPSMEMQPQFETEGMSWRIRLDYNVQGFDPRHAITNAGV